MDHKEMQDMLSISGMRGLSSRNKLEMGAGGLALQFDKN